MQWVMAKRKIKYRIKVLILSSENSEGFKEHLCLIDYSGMLIELIENNEELLKVSIIYQSPLIQLMENKV
ncbi:hypothetical protein RchiOBHm_Chr2g0116061 [Rosa chinensis]|uniref:Uncharacterized protein n=1 Tax=Rosa chinensis TaxID=74649 RepID=A0A2P6RR49_ROSCH|nr:hypothetical protein RchiOBHm_Chr2g0116061 [Rosa chinensis]